MSGMFDSLLSLFGDMAAMGRNDAAYNDLRRYLEANAKNWQDFDTGGLNLARDISMGPSAYESMQVDPAGRNAQLKALASLANEVDAKGLSEADLMTQRQAEGEANRLAQGQQGAAMQRAAARGMGGGNASLMAQLQAGQAGANTAGMQALGSAAASRNRAMQAAQLMGQQSGQLRGQDYQQASDRARAQDLVNQFNASMAYQTQAMNLNQKQREMENRLRKLQGFNQAQGDLGRSYVNQAGANVPLERDAWTQGGRTVDNLIDTTMSAYSKGMSGGAGGGGGGGGFDIQSLLKGFGGGGNGSTWT